MNLTILIYLIPPILFTKGPKHKGTDLEIYDNMLL